MEPFLLGKEPFLPDFQLFYTLELSQMFSELFEIPEMHLFRDDPALQTLSRVNYLGRFDDNYDGRLSLLATS
ncbi:MAG: hypothetical protein IPG31_12080 [Nitrosomonas sp.]|nr:hypothetical protein [Nitrosomonas sp.]